MSDASLYSVFIQTISLGTLSILIIRRVTKTYITAATAFWFAWIVLLGGSIISVNNNWINISSVGDRSLYFISILNYGAFIGFLIGSIPYKFNIKENSCISIFIERSETVIHRISKKALLILFLLGMIFLYVRIKEVGFDQNYFEKVRNVYLQRNRPWIEWIGTHLSVFAGFIIILYGVQHAINKIIVKELIYVIVAAAPVGIANGSRIFILHYFLLYLASLLLMRSESKINKFLLDWGEWRKVISILLTLLILFSIIGFLRGGYGDRIQVLYNIIIWPVSTVEAMDSWIGVALHNHQTNGLFTFGWFSSFFNEIGLINFDEELKIVNGSLSNLMKSHNSIAYIPKSIIPELIFDFGPKGLFWGILLISIFLQMTTILFVGRGLFLHTLSVLCLVAAFSTIQQSVFSPVFVVTLLWAGVISFLFRINVNPRNNTNYEKYNQENFLCH